MQRQNHRPQALKRRRRSHLQRLPRKRQSRLPLLRLLLPQNPQRPRLQLQNRRPLERPQQPKPAPPPKDTGPKPTPLDNELVQRLKARFGEAIREATLDRKQAIVLVEAARWHEVNFIAAMKKNSII